MFIVIWVLAGFGNPWFLWIVGPWGAVMLARWISGGHSGQEHRGRRGDRGQIDGGPQDP